MRKILLSSALGALGLAAAFSGSPDRIAPGCGSDWQCETAYPQHLVYQPAPADWRDDMVPPYGPGDDDGEPAVAVDHTRPFRRT